ncbi:MAG: PorT family protein [Bacteroidia bacterium]|nr:PorT family protein [Bacteroidia bacterium]
MKKDIIIFVGLFLIASFCSAQLKYGPRVSLGSTSLGGGNTSFGFQVGLFINAELKDRMGLQPEVLFSIKNGSQNGSFEGASGPVKTKTRYTFTYIDIPLYGYVPVSKHITFLAGPQIGVVNKATQITTGPGISGDDAKRTDVAETKAKMGIAAGIDFNLSSPLRFGLRFSTNGGSPFGGKSTFVGATMAYYMDW